MFKYIVSRSILHQKNSVCQRYKYKKFIAIDLLQLELWLDVEYNCPTVSNKRNVK